ncbi:HAMP domain-containing histidine kinase [Paenibacillus spiritus]|uniref:histidine kinase n=1 Tax=Paenibacillus spiritus TaxID=2496557 RepID=A0A5J5GCD7_9BACL|nr:HAMP domain-containing sensor histidine kinase [Paenibacillus spiritus]KAA9005826.1 HAMP domain-containing histidine kinase [Paenibacillus spiritus]
MRTGADRRSPDRPLPGRRRPSALLCGGLFLLSLAGYAAGMTALADPGRSAISLTAVFALVVLLLFAGWAWAERTASAGTLAEAGEMLERALRGEPQPGDCEESPLSSLRGKLSRVVEIAAEGERRATEERARLQALLSDISHQTRTPLANILLYGGLLAEASGREAEGRGTGSESKSDAEGEDGSGDEIRRLIAELMKQAERLDWLITSLTRLSRLETGTLQMKPEIRPLLDGIAEAVSQVYPKAERRNTRLTVEGAEGLEALYDRRWTAEALFNLLDNAVKYSPRGGEVRVRAEAYELFVRVDVADNGPGIEESELARVFGRFYRGAGSEETEGVGLGLYVARSIANAQGGYVKASSVPGEGAVFSLFLPRPEPRPQK